jgi:nitrite reductase (NADH) small subunit
MSLPSLSPAREAAPAEWAEWTDVCGYDDLAPGAGAAALIAGEQIALVKTRGGAVHAIGNFDPFSKAFVLARGIVGDKGGVPKLASPMYKQCFDLATGVCLDDPKVRVPVYRVRIVRGRILVGRRAHAGSP